MRAVGISFCSEPIGSPPSLPETLTRRGGQGWRAALPPDLTGTVSVSFGPGEERAQSEMAMDVGATWLVATCAQGEHPWVLPHLT